jgi:predicted transcriptional regulator
VSNQRSANLPGTVTTGGTMSTLTRQTISLQASADVVKALQKIADQEGRQIQAVLEDALRAYVAQQDGTGPREHVLAAFEESLQTYDALYRELAK